MSTKNSQPTSGYYWAAIAAASIITAIVIYVITRQSKKEPPILLFERLLDNENKVYIGIHEKNQVIHMRKTNKMYKLLKFRQEENSLFYEFENNISLMLVKKDGYFTMYISFVLMKIVEPTVVRYFKPIGISNVSDEFDKIYELFQTTANCSK